MPRNVFYQSVGPELSWYDLDVEGATLIKRGSVTAPAKVQYLWPHPSKKHVYVVSSDGGPGAIPGRLNIANVFQVDAASGALTALGQNTALPSRPIHCCVDASGGYLLTAYNIPSNVTVHRIETDGRIAEQIAPRGKLDVGIFGHQVMVTPNNRSAILVTRGNNASFGKEEDPGALKVFGFYQGVLSKLQSVAPDNGFGFGPRHLDFHPSQPWVLVSVERQSHLYVYGLDDDGTLSHAPLFVKSSLTTRANHGPHQAAGAIHVHPNGRFVYLTNRNSGTVDVGGVKVHEGGENNVAVFAIDQSTGEPTLIQNADAHTIHLRTFSIDPSGRLLIAASIQAMRLRDGSTLPAALVLYRIGDDGKLSFARKYDVDTGDYMQFWSGIVALP